MLTKNLPNKNTQTPISAKMNQPSSKNKKKGESARPEKVKSRAFFNSILGLF
jgi:hypothetical protein